KEETIHRILTEATEVWVCLMLDGYGIKLVEDIESIGGNEFIKKAQQHLEEGTDFIEEKNLSVGPASLIVYAAFNTDYICRNLLGISPIYKVKNPLPMMDQQALNTTKLTDFFVRPVSSYQPPIITDLKPVAIKSIWD